MRAPDLAALLLCVVCGGLFLLRNSDARTSFDAAPGLEAPRSIDGLLQREPMQKTTGSLFLCRGECASTSPWPSDSDPSSWLQELGQNQAKEGIGDRPDAPSLIRFDGRWIILWGERSDRLEVIVENQGAGVWPRQRFESLYGSPWWGPLR